MAVDQHRMPCWYYEKEDFLRTPSICDGIDPQTEKRYRREGARFILELSNRLHLRYDTWATAIVFFHRFYMCHSFKAFPRYVTAACCLMLAGKVEETPKKCRDIIRVARSVLSPQHFATFGEDPREEVMMYERVLLKTIKFDLQVAHPYGFLLQYAKRIKGPQDKLKEIVQIAWSFINDSLETTLCLQWEPEIIACSVLYLAARIKSFTITDWESKNHSDQAWYECFVEGMTTEVLEDVCHRILDIYSDAKDDNEAVAPKHNISSNDIHSSLSSVGVNRKIEKTPSPPPPPPPPPSSSSKGHSKAEPAINTTAPLQQSNNHNHSSSVAFTTTPTTLMTSIPSTVPITTSVAQPPGLIWRQPIPPTFTTLLPPPPQLPTAFPPTGFGAAAVSTAPPLSSSIPMTPTIPPPPPLPPTVLGTSAPPHVPRGPWPPLAPPPGLLGVPLVPPPAPTYPPPIPPSTRHTLS